MSLQVLKKATAVAAKQPQMQTQTQTLVKALSTASYTERQARLGRPVSPHVEIYSFPITAVSSVSNRFTGIGLSVGLMAASALSAVGADVPALIYAAQDTIPGFAPISKALVAFPIAYHTFSAVRHVAWDIKPELINNTDGPRSSYAIFGAAALVTLGGMAYTIKAPTKKQA